MSVLNNAVSEVLSDIGGVNAARRLMQATLLDTNGDNQPAIEEAQMKVFVKQSGVEASYEVADMDAGQNLTPKPTTDTPDKPRER